MGTPLGPKYNIPYTDMDPLGKHYYKPLPGASRWLKSASSGLRARGSGFRA